MWPVADSENLEKNFNHEKLDGHDGHEYFVRRFRRLDGLFKKATK